MIPITIFTGFVGSGKTTVIINALQRLPKDIKVVVLKNEFGDDAVDSKLVDILTQRSADSDQSAQTVSRNISSVKEIVNGCLCCVLVGQLQNAIEDIVINYQPDRIIIESSGSAQPAPLVWQIKQMSLGVQVDAVINVVDALNFTGYEDTSYTAKLQAKYTDLIMLNKIELCDERQLDLTLDRIYELNPDASIHRYMHSDGVDVNLLFGIQSKLDLTDDVGKANVHDHNTEITTLKVLRKKVADSQSSLIKKLELESLLSGNSMSKDKYYRIKGYIWLTDKGGHVSLYILNWAFGRYQLHDIEDLDLIQKMAGSALRLTVMGRDLTSEIDGGVLTAVAETLSQTFQCSASDIQVVNLSH
ncbi:hypothetical protein MP228_000433 [Amoeboaphelidium protococcarum]|nr:hypothetical protein MP228_000433 [Amoeboaphelidium protococcarum]